MKYLAALTILAAVASCGWVAATVHIFSNVGNPNDLAGIDINLIIAGNFERRLMPTPADTVGREKRTQPRFSRTHGLVAPVRGRIGTVIVQDAEIVCARSGQDHVVVGGAVALDDTEARPRELDAIMSLGEIGGLQP